MLKFSSKKADLIIYINRTHIGIFVLIDNSNDFFSCFLSKSLISIKPKYPLSVNIRSFFSINVLTCIVVKLMCQNIGIKLFCNIYCLSMLKLSQTTILFAMSLTDIKQSAKLTSSLYVNVITVKSAIKHTKPQ